MRGEEDFKGLIALCGMAGNEHISCTYGLGLLDRLLDISHNMMAESFL